MSTPATPCPRCGGAAQPGQEYCLDCGARLDVHNRGAVDRAAETIAARHPRAGAWLLPAVLGLLIAVGGAAAAIALSGNGNGEAAIPVATGGSLTVTESTSTLTAPEPTTTATTAPPETAPPTAPPTATAHRRRRRAPPPPPAIPATITWPRDRRGLDDRPPLAPAGERPAGRCCKGQGGTGRRLRQVGVLDSSRYASLHPGYYVVFTGSSTTSPKRPARCSGRERSSRPRIRARSCRSATGALRCREPRQREHASVRADGVSSAGNRCNRVCNSLSSPYTDCRNSSARHPISAYTRERTGSDDRPDGSRNSCNCRRACISIRERSIARSRT